MIESNFHTPQRQSLVGIIVIFLNILQKNIRSFLPLIIVMAVNFEADDLLKTIIMVVCFVIVLIAYAFLDYWNFTFYIDESNQEFRLNKGIFNKSKTSINLGKIQQVSLNQNLIQKIFNVFEVKIDSAGSEETEVVIKAVSQNQAFLLKEQLLAFEHLRLTNLEAAPDFAKAEIGGNFGQKLLTIKLITLFKVGITSNYIKSIGLILFVLFQIYDNFQKVGERYGVNDQSIMAFFSSDVFILNVFKIAAFVLLIILLINIARTIFKFYHFEIKKQKGVLQISYGLLNTRNTMLKPERVQKVTLSQNYFQKKLDVIRVFVSQIISTDSEGKDTSIEIPGCSAQEKQAIFDLIYHKMPYEGIELKPNIRKVLKSISLLIVLPIGVYAIYSFYVDSSLFEHVNFVLGYFLFISMMLFFGFRNYRLYLAQDFVIKKSGVWDISYEIIEVKKIQNITVSQLFWHQSLDLGSIEIETAGGSIHFQTTNYTQLKNFTDLWLYKIEKSNESWM